MHPDRRVEIRIGRTHDRRRGAAGRQTGDVDPSLVDRELAHDLPGDPGDQRRLALAALLVARIEPVPAFGSVGGLRLGGVGDKEDMLLRQGVHLGAGGEVIRRLGAAVQHHDQGDRAPVVAARNIELVGPAAGGVRERGLVKPGAGGDGRGGRPALGAEHPIKLEERRSLSRAVAPRTPRLSRGSFLRSASQRRGPGSARRARRLKIQDLHRRLGPRLRIG